MSKRTLSNQFKLPSPQVTQVHVIRDSSLSRLSEFLHVLCAVLCFPPRLIYNQLDLYVITDTLAFILPTFALVEELRPQTDPLKLGAR